MSAPEGRSRPRPPTIRSLLFLEAVAELIKPGEFPFPEVRVQLRPQGRGAPWGLTVLGTGSVDALREVARREVDIAIVNPSGALTVAYRGKGPFTEPAPLRAIAVIPSFDQMAFGVAEGTGLRSFSEMKERRYPLRVSMRAERDNATHLYVDEVLQAYGLSLADIEAWGGRVSYDPGLPYQGRLELLKRGEVDAIFDEGVRGWIDLGVGAGMRFLPIDEPVLQRLEELGFRRAVLARERFPSLAADVPTLDFSGWPIYCHADVADELIYGFCRALDARKSAIPTQDRGDLPVSQMCRDTPEGPLDVPLHPAAERYWREAGYL